MHHKISLYVQADLFLSTVYGFLSATETHFSKKLLAKATVSCYSIFSFQVRRHTMNRISATAIFNYYFYYFFIKEK